MMRTEAATNNSENATGSSRNVPSKAEGIALCSAFVLVFVLVVVGNLLTIALFGMNRSLRKKSLHLVINMAFADLMLGILSLPLFIHSVGYRFGLWKGGWPMSLSIFYTIVDTFFSQASLISAYFISGERFYAIYWPFKHRTLSTRAYHIIIFSVWVLTLLVTALFSTTHFLFSVKRSMYYWIPYVLIITFIICGCNIGIWRKFRRGIVASQQQTRNSRNKRLTKTLLFVSVLGSLCWILLVILNCLIFVYDVKIPWKFYDLVNLINYSNSFANPVMYALRIPEFREALALCCLRRAAAPNMMDIKRRSKKTPSTELRALRTDSSLLQLNLKEEVLDTKL